MTWPNGYDWDPIALPDEMKGPVSSIFARVFIEDGALTWPNGYDWDPIALPDEMKGPVSSIAPKQQGNRNLDSL